MEATSLSFIEECKQFAVLHARSQQLSEQDWNDVLTRIHHDDTEEPGNWTDEWLRLGDRYRNEGKKAEAYQCYNLARFPYVRSTLGSTALKRCVETFREWVAESGKAVQYRSFTHQGQSVPFYLSGLTAPDRPLLLVIGGIVSLKEQWSPFLFLGPKLGFTVAVIECPGVGENPLVYTENAHQMISAVLDSLAGEVNVDETYFVGMSFGGQLGIAAALVDARIRGITTVGAPLHHFYQDRDNWDRLPRITRLTLAHLCRIPEDRLFEPLQRFAFEAAQLRKLTVPLHYVLSLRDEIIPQREKEFLLHSVEDLELMEFDDVHGSPNHLGEIQKYIPLSVLRQQNSKRVLLKGLLRVALFVQTLKRKVKTSRS
jgi:esterase FrsA